MTESKSNPNIPRYSLKELGLGVDESKSNLPIPPGEYLREVLHDRECRVTMLAQRIHCDTDDIFAIISGDMPITPHLAAQFEEWLGVPAHTWLGLENQYREALARQEKGGG